MVVGAPPIGTVTFLFSDIEGSTRLLQELGDRYDDILEGHKAIVRASIRRWDGTEISTEGDSFFVVFPGAMGAARAAAEVQRSLADHPFPLPVRVRMGLHTGEGRLAAGNYVGIDVHRAARIAAAGHGGQILVSDATRGLVEPELPADLSLSDLGPHRLKDLAQPEHLYQLVVRGLRSEFPPLRSLDARPNNLPVQLTRFIGRQEQVTEVKRRLLNGARLLTLTGPGGTGKTRLALEVADAALTAFEDGAWFVDLAPITDPALVVSTIAEALGVQEKPDCQLQDTLEGSFKDRAMLLVLDNFEQVVEAGTAVERLLRAAPRLKVLVTSRSVLHRYGEHEFPVPPFALPDPRNLLDMASLTRFEAIDLFVERATAAKPDFALTQENASSIAEITIRLDGLPLAIELAASRVKILSPQAIVERLGMGSPILVSRVPDAPARQRTLRGAIEWSYELLKEDERRLFEQMSVFPAGATLDAVEAVCAPTPGADVIEGLSSLADNSLLRQVEGELGEPRYVMLETIKEYAAERLEERPEIGLGVRRAHAEHFADFAQRQRERLAGQRRELALAAMAADIDNLRLAWRYWVGEGELDRLNQLVDGLWALYEARGWYHATIELTTDLLDVLSSGPSTPERAMQEVMLRTSLARALMAIHGYTSVVEAAFTRALELFKGQPALPQVFPVLRGLASFYTYRGEFDKGAEVGREILRLAEAQKDPSMRVDGHLVLGSSTALGNDLRGGLEHLDMAIAGFESEAYRSPRFRLGNNPGVASYTTSALILWLLGHPDRARERGNRAVDLATDLQHPFTLAYALFHSGFLHLWRREPDLALGRATAVLEVADEHELKIWQALGRFLQGAATTGLGRFEDGLAKVRRGLDLYEGLKTPPVFWPLILSLHAGACLQSGRSREGLGLIEEAIEIAGSRLALSPEFFLLKGDLLLAPPNRDGETAEPWFRWAFEGAQELGARMPQLRAAVRLCRLWRDQGDMERGGRLLGPVYETFTEGFATLDLIEAKELLSPAGDQSPRYEAPTQ
jgi:predicted ATPase/class 3 adenylate cyclase